MVMKSSSSKLDLWLKIAQYIELEQCKMDVIIMDLAIWVKLSLLLQWIYISIEDSRLLENYIEGQTFHLLTTVIISVINICFRI